MICELVHEFSEVAIQMIFLIALIVLSYLTFIFFAESFNPFAKPKIHQFRMQWRYGWRMALTVMISGFAILAMLILTQLTLHIAIGVGLIIAAVLGFSFSIDKIRVVLHG